MVLGFGSVSLDSITKSCHKKKSLLTQLTLRVPLRLKFPNPNCRFIKKNIKHNQYAINNQNIGKFEEKRTNWVPEEIEESEGALAAAGAASPLGTVDS